MLRRGSAQINSGFQDCVEKGGGTEGMIERREGKSAHLLNCVEEGRKEGGWPARLLNVLLNASPKDCAGGQCTSQRWRRGLAHLFKVLFNVSLNGCADYQRTSS